MLTLPVASDFLLGFVHLLLKSSLGSVLFCGGPVCSQDMPGRAVHLLLPVGPKASSMTMVTKKKGKGKGFTLILGFEDFHPMR